MAINFLDYKKVSKILKNNGIDVLLFGSLGVSVYLGNFKEFSDLDLLIDRKWLFDRWFELKRIMQSNGFNLINDEKKIFLDKDGMEVDFNENDGCLLPVEIEVNKILVRTISKESFLKIYKNIIKKRNKKMDRFIINNLQEIISKRIPDNWEELVEMMDFIKDCSWEFLRFEGNEEEYKKYKTSMSREELVKEVRMKIGNDGPILLNNNFPYKKLLQKLPEVKHHVLWNKDGRLDGKEIRRLIEREFRKKRYCWMERSEKGKSIPEIWHCHVFVEVG